MLQADTVELFAGQVLPSDPCEPLYFPCSGVISILFRDGRICADTALVGREGFVGMEPGRERPEPSIGAEVRVAGSSLRIRADRMRRALLASPALRHRLHTHLQMSLEQAGYAIVAASRCTIEQRLARWLLMVQNRVDRDEFAITHEAVAEILGVRRPGVTVALHMLEGRYAVRAYRGRLQIRSRDLLIAAAGPAYRDIFYDAQPAVLDPAMPERNLSHVGGFGGHPATAKAGPNGALAS